MSSSDDYHRHRLRTTTKFVKVSVKPFQRLVGFGAKPREKNKEKRKVNGNLIRRPPARPIALYKVFEVSLKPFQRLVGFGAKPREEACEISRLTDERDNDIIRNV